MKAEVSKINAIFKEISRKLLPKYKGKIVAIDVDSGDYALGDTELDAYKKALEKHPDKQFIFKRIGFSSTHFVGAF